jgi:subtilisin family serine protease
MIGDRMSKRAVQSATSGHAGSRRALAAASVCVFALVCGADAAQAAQRMMSMMSSMRGAPTGYTGGGSKGYPGTGDMGSHGGMGHRFGGLGIGIISGIAAGTAATPPPPVRTDVVVTRTTSRSTRSVPQTPSHSARHGGGGGGGGGGAGGGSSSGVPPANERRYVPDEVLMEFAGLPSDQTFNALATRYRLVPIEARRIALTDSTWVRWRIADGRTVPAVVRALEAGGQVRSAQPNYLFALQEATRSGRRDQMGAERAAEIEEQAGDPIQYALAKLHLPEAQALARGRRVVVAVIDTEIDQAHPELAGTIADTYDALGTPTPMEAHGTGIAGAIAAHARLLGAAPEVRILAVRALGGGKGSTFSIIKGLDWAVDHDARVINMSFAGPSDPALAHAVASAHAKGRILIAAVGNKGANSPPLFPAADPNVIAVTATDANDRLFEAANRGSHVAIAAPGVDILVPAPGSLYVMSSGTSFASAFVSGVAALLAERKPDLSPDAAKNILMSTAHHLGPKPHDDQFGAGLMDANQAILAVAGRPAAAGLSRGLTH